MKFDIFFREISWALIITNATITIAKYRQFRLEHLLDSTRNLLERTGTQIFARHIYAANGHTYY